LGVLAQMTEVPPEQRPFTSGHAVAMAAFGAAALACVPAARRRVPSSVWPRIGLLGGGVDGRPVVLFSTAERLVDSALAGMLNAAAPLFTALIAAVWAHRAPSARQARGLLVGFGGVVLVSAPALGSGRDDMLGIGLVLGSVLLYGIAFNTAGALQRAHSALPAMWRAQLVALGVVCTAVAFALFATLAGSVAPTRAALTTYPLRLAPARTEPLSAPASRTPKTNPCTQSLPHDAEGGRKWRQSKPATT
jgi:drug/metabolite transporter (DMT)-like permease